MPNCFLVIDTTLVSDMTIEDEIKDEKLQYNINREAAKIWDYRQVFNDENEYFTGEEILPHNQTRIIEQAKFTYSPLGKAFEKQIKTVEEQRKETNLGFQSFKIRGK